MSRLLATCAAILITTAAAAAPEPVRLGDRALDAVHAGAISGVRLTAFASSPGGSALASIDPTNYSGPLLAGASASTNGDSGAALIQGEVYNRTTPLSSVSVGLYQGQVRTEGQGTAGTRAEGLYAIRQGNVFTIPG